MKVANIRLENFKRFGNLSIPIKNGLTGDIADQFLLLGDNGTGKTTVLQAVALCLSLASRRTHGVTDFDWMGWVPGRFERWGRPVVELEVHFDAEEIEATREAARRWYDLRGDRGRGVDEPYVEPGDAPVVRLRLEGSQYSAPSREQLYQFCGRAYAAGLLQTDPGARRLFESLPGVFWFDQFRNLASPPLESASPRRESENGGEGRVSFDVGVARLRQYLNRWQLTRLSNPPRHVDYLRDLEDMYRRVFPSRSLGMPEPMFRGGIPSPEDFYFIINDGNRSYDIEEMSAGEQAVFPILYEFVRLRIRKSVVLIDEIDLNLHPPLAQALLAALPALGPGCQFLLTTHSEAISSVVSPEVIYRLPGGQLCL